MDNKKVVLVTGGTSGIGFGTIEYLLEQKNYEIISLSRGDKNLSLAKVCFCSSSQDFVTHFLHVTPHDGTLVFHYVVGDMYLHYGLSPIN